MGFPKFQSVGCVLAVFLVILFSQADGENLENVAIIIQFSHQIDEEITNIFGTTTNNIPIDDGTGLNRHVQSTINNETVMQKISPILNKMNAFEKNWDINFATTIQNFNLQLNQRNQLHSRLWELNNHITQISRRYQLFQEYSKAPEKYERATLESFAWEYVSPSTGILENLEMLHRVLTPDAQGFGNQNFFELFIDSLKNEGEIVTTCDSQQSPQQMLYNLYNSIAITKIKGYAMVQFSWLLLNFYDYGSFTEEMQLTRTRYNTMMTDLILAVQKGMASASPDLWKCDTSNSGTSASSTELIKLVQGYIVNEVDLNGDETCTKTCAHYQYARVTGCYEEEHCSTLKKCTGRVYNCKFIASDVSVCPADRKSGRRYNYLEYGNGIVYGKKGGCGRGFDDVESWTRWFVHCSYCFCYCDDDSVESDRYFNLRNVVADIESNKVITGLKFVKENKVIHLQIEQGELLGKGKVNNYTTWKPVDAYSPNDFDLRDGVDYLKLSLSKRAIDLDELTAPPGHVITGVRFRTLSSHLNLEIRITPFNFTTGTLVKNLEKSTWHGNSNTVNSKVNPRKILRLSEPDRSTNSALPSVPNFHPNQYIEFTPTDERKDAAQSTVPFIDTQPVVPYPRIPIVGAGIYYKGRPGFGGYIAPKLQTYDFAPHLQINKSVVHPAVGIHGDVIGTPRPN